MSSLENIDTDTQRPEASAFKRDYHFAWVINNFRKLRGQVGSWHASAKFFTGSDYEWYLKLFVAGYDEATSDHVGVQAYLMKKQTYRKLKLMIECSILGKIDGKKQSRTTTLVTDKVSHKSRVTFKRFIPRAELLSRPELLPNGELTIACQISLNAFSHVAEIEPIDLLDDYKRIMNDHKFSDFTFVVFNTEFKVHRAILAAKSPVFENMFDNNMPESSEMRLHIDDIVPEVMKRLLHFIYIGHTDVKGFAGEMLVAAEKYQLYALKELCEKELAIKLNLHNVYAVLRLADEYNARELKRNAMEFFGRHLKRLKEAKNFKVSVRLLPVNLQTDIICALADKF